MLEKPSNKPSLYINLKGENGNIFAVLGHASKELRECGQSHLIKEMTENVFTSKSYDQALEVIENYVEIVQI